jgi:hypothetical protein
MSFRFDVKRLRSPTKPIVILAKEIVALYKVQNFNNKKLVYLGLVKMLFSLKRKVCVLF